MCDPLCSANALTDQKFKPSRGAFKSKASLSDGFENEAFLGKMVSQEKPLPGRWFKQ